MKLRLLALPLLAALLLPSCVELDSGYGYTSYSRGYGVAEDDYSYRPSYYSRPYYGNSSYYSRPYYGNSSSYSRPYYGNSSYYGGSTHAYYPPVRTNHDHHEEDERIRLTGGGDGRHDNRPNGFHSKDWFEDRGYNLHRYNYKDEDGDVKHKAHGPDKDDKKHR